MQRHSDREMIGLLQEIAEWQRRTFALLHAAVHRSSMDFGDPYFRSKATGRIIPMADFSIPNDEIATVPLDFSDIAGRVKPPSGGSVTSSDPTIATVTLAADGSSVDITPVADGVGVSITYHNPNLANVPDAVLVVDIVDPSATSDAFDTANATFKPKGP